MSEKSEYKELHPGLDSKIARLLTADGEGREEKGIVLVELVETVNPNFVRIAIEKFLKDNHYDN